jgi:hypothetical protein
MRKICLCLPFVLSVLVIGCGGGYGRVGLADAPKVVNVSSYDPKEKQRSGDSFSSTDVSALKRNGSHGLIARCGKGRALDEKCADFLHAAEREGMMLGTYYFVLKGVDPVWQAEQYVSRLRQIAPGKRVLLVGDFDSKSSPEDLVRFKADRRAACRLSGKQRAAAFVTQQCHARSEAPHPGMPLLARALFP